MGQMRTRAQKLTLSMSEAQLIRAAVVIIGLWTTPPRPVAVVARTINVLTAKTDEKKGGSLSGVQIKTSRARRGACR